MIIVVAVLVYIDFRFGQGVGWVVAPSCRPRVSKLDRGGPAQRAVAHPFQR